MELQQIKELALKVTGTFEGSTFDSITGNFDGQLMSCGIMQWCLGQKSLQNEILRPFILKYENYDAEVTLKIPLLLSGAMTAEAWAAYIMGNPAMKGLFKKLLGSNQMKEVQIEAASKLFDKALEIVGGDTTSVKAVLWAFDIVVQNGSLKGCALPTEMPLFDMACAELMHKLQLETDAKYVSKQNFDIWVECLDAMADEYREDATRANHLRLAAIYTTLDRAQKVNLKWKADVLSRKLTILLGRGYVHGHYINIDNMEADIARTSISST